MAAASHIRDRFSLDGWLALDDLSKTIGKMSKTAQPGDDMARAMSVLLRKLSGFSGLVHENMYRSMGWRFLSIGRSLERASMLSSMLANFTSAEAEEGSLDLTVEVADSTMTHRQRYAVSTNRSTIIDLLALDPLNPRSISYQVNQISDHVNFLPGLEGRAPSFAVARCHPANPHQPCHQTAGDSGCCGTRPRWAGRLPSSPICCQPNI